MEARREKQASTQGGCGKADNERCEGCKRAAQLAPRRTDACGPTAFRSVRPLTANANDAPYLNWLND